MGFREALQEAPSTLTDAERRIGAILLGDRHGAPLYTASQLAQRADVHESTVVRFAQKLGYSGYLSMRLDLAADSLGHSHISRPQPEGDEASLARVIRGQVEVLQKLEDNISQETIDDSMAALLSAERVFVVASGLVGPLADFLSRKMALLGIPSIVVHETGTELAHQLANVGPKDIAVFFTLSSEYDVIRAIEQGLVDQGSTVVLVTDQPILTYQPTAQYVLAVPRSDLKHGVFVVLATVAYALDYALMQQLARRGGKKA